MIATLDEVERALLACPVPEGVAIIMRQEDISRPLIELIDGHWEAAIQAVYKNGLPVWKPASFHRPRRERFIATLAINDSPIHNMLKLRIAATTLNMKWRSVMKKIVAGRKSYRNRKARGYRHPGTGGWPKGKPAGHPKRYCRKCDRRHPKGPCPLRGTPRWPPE